MDNGSLDTTLIGNGIVLTENAVIRFGPRGSTKTLTISGTTLTLGAGIAIAGGTGTLTPLTSDGGTIGTAALPYSDVYLASGAVLDFGNANVVWTHSAGIFTLTTGQLALGSHVATLNADQILISQRTRVTVAEMNAGKTLLAAVAGLKYRLHDIKVITIGGNAAATANATGIAVYGTQTTAVALYTAILAALLQHAVCQLNTANTSVLNAGASFVPNDAATAITCRAVSAGNYDLITATHFDVLLTYTLEA